MKHLFFIIVPLLFMLQLKGTAQQAIFSEYDREDSKDIEFEIIGKLSDNIVVYKNIRWKHKLSIYDSEMKTKETVKLDFVPEKTLNVDFVAYPDHFYMIYQYQKQNILHCMGVKMDANGKKMGEPVEMDTTQISMTASNKIYTTIYSEDKKKIMVYKIQKKFEKFNIVTLLFDDQLHLVNKSGQTMDFDERREKYGDFMLDNEGNFVFTFDRQAGYRENSNQLQLAVKKASKDSLSYYDINLDKKYIDEVSLKIDNLNNRYIINSFYYTKSRGSIEGLFTCTWDKVNEKQNPSAFNFFDNTIRTEVYTDGLIRYAFDDFLIRQIYVKKDGSFLLAAEDYSTQTRGSNNNSWDRWDYLNNNYSLSSNSYYSYSPYRGYYRSPGSFNTSSTRYYLANIMVLSVDKYGNAEWAKVIHKDQFEDDDEDYLSYTTMNAGGEIRFFFNMDGKYQVIADQTVAPDGTIKRNATIKSQEKGYQFMARYGKQVGARQLVIPCSYRGYISFAKLEF